MTLKSCLKAALFVSLSFAAVLARAGVPGTITYQGYLQDGDGNPVSGSLPISFALYDDSASGNMVWDESHPAVEVNDGIFSATLGLQNPIEPELLSGGGLWLEVDVDGEIITPRTRLTSMPYSVRSGAVDNFSPGPNNTDGGNYTFIAGDSNVILSDYCSILGGFSNEIEALYSGDTLPPDPFSEGGYSGPGGPCRGSCGILVGGHNNEAYGYCSAVLWGERNRSYHGWSFIGGGRKNLLMHQDGCEPICSAILCGDSCTIGGCGRYSVIAGGYLNFINHWFSFIATAYQSSAYDRYNFIGSGVYNITGSDDEDPWNGVYSTVVNGRSNRAAGYTAFVGNGHYQNVNGKYGFIGGGSRDTVWGAWGFIGGGQYNSIGTELQIDTAAGYSVISGGRWNFATGYACAIGGGFSNTVLGNYATVPGGLENTANEFGSFAAGFRARALNVGSFVWNDSTGSIFSSTGDNQFLINASGGVGINTDSPSEELHVVGDICATGTIGACSDRRYKTQVERLSDGLDRVLKLRGVRFQWKRDEYPECRFEEGEQLGLVAQEVQEIVPEVVSQGRDGYYSIDYGKLTPLLVEAVKELKTDNDAKQVQIDQLKAQVDQLRRLINTALEASPEGASF